MCKWFHAWRQGRDSPRAAGEGMVPYLSQPWDRENSFRLRRVTSVAGIPAGGIFEPPGRPRSLLYLS